MKLLRNEQELRDELKNVFNRLGIDNDMNTPDWILADYVSTHLQTLKLMQDTTKKWFGDNPAIGPERKNTVLPSTNGGFNGA